ncbi:uncharacterized protein [Rutidosis leptorrhynchoides]|uniref:uncharacterized protein n=1 Tax=Rutidosis leptorrhynchoides TaxID=125765 RepID=UPI003A99A7BF
MEEVLNGHPLRSYDLFRMRPHVFRKLCNRLREIDLLQDQCNISVEEGVAMCLYIFSQSARMRVVGDRFQHSLARVHWWAKKVLRALIGLSQTIIKFRNRGNVQPEILDNLKWFPYFQLGLSYRGRKSTLTQNVLAACYHDMMFTFVCSGWEGIANDSRVFIDAVTRAEHAFPMPTDNKY